MTWQNKTLIGLGAAVIFTSFALIIKYQRDIIAKQKIIETSIVEQKQLSDNIIRSQSSYATKKDIEAFAKSNNIDLDPIRQDLDKLQANIKSIQTVKIYSTAQNASNLPPTSTTKNPDPVSNIDEFNYRKNRQELALTEVFGTTTVPFGKVGFSAWKPQPFDLQVNQRQYKVVNVLGEDEDGRHYTYSKVSVTVDDKEYPLKIDESKQLEEFPSNKWFFHPRLFVGGSIGLDKNFYSDLSMAFFARGKTRKSPDWIFVSPGISYSNQFMLFFNPFSYNIGNDLPFVDNVYIGPSIATDFNQYTLLAGIRVGL
jgi:hypothetical protein